MSRPSQATKDAAFENQNQASVVAIATAPAAGLVALIPVAGPFVVVGILAVGAGYGLRALRQGRIVHDPPRHDFSVPTTLPPPMVAMKVFSDTALDAPASGLVRATDETARAFEAMVLALERASGAEIAGDGAMEEARLGEAFEFAQLASDGLLASSEFAGPFRDALEEFRDPAFAVLEALGLPRDHLRTIVEVASDDPVTDLSLAVGRAAESDYGLAEYLRGAIADRSLIQRGTSGAPAETS
jgi:hypothetical protein